MLHDLGAVFVRHYVDNFHDFVRPGPIGPDWETARDRAQWLFALMEALGVPFHEVQIGTHFKTLGWYFDTVRMLITVCEKKRNVARRLLRGWISNEKCHLKELERVTGLLYWLSLAFYELSPFLRCLLVVKRSLEKKRKSTGKNPFKLFAYFSKATKSNLKLCLSLLMEWEGSRSLWDWESAVTTAHIWCDASEWGFGAYFVEAGQYFFREWTKEERKDAFRSSRMSMLQLEARAVVAALHTWGASLRCQRVQVVSDNEPTVGTGTSGICDQPDCQKTLRALWVEKMKFQCVVDLVHWTSKQNYAADFLSRQDGEEAFLAIEKFANFCKVPASNPSTW
jgi:hypothetical protein